MPSSDASSAICASLREKTNRSSLISSSTCLLILYLLRTAPTAKPILALPRKVPRSTRSRSGCNLASVARKRASRLRARSSAKNGERQNAGSVEHLDLRRFECRDPINSLFTQGSQICRCHHAAIGNEHHAAELEAALELLNLCQHGLMVELVALEDFDGDWTSVAIAEQPVDDL